MNVSVLRFRKNTIQNVSVYRSEYRHVSVTSRAHTEAAPRQQIKYVGMFFFQLNVIGSIIFSEKYTYMDRGNIFNGALYSDQNTLRLNSSNTYGWGLQFVAVNIRF